MTTFNDLAQDVLSTLRGTVRSQEQSTHLTVSVDEDDTAWSVADAGRIAPGRAEVGDELVYVDSIDSGANTLTVAPYGRGLDGSTAATHAAGSRVVSNPRFPMLRVKNAINDTIRGFSGFVFVSDSIEITTDSAAVSYELPVDVVSVLGVQSETSDGWWASVGSWQFNPFANTDDFPNGKSITLGSCASGTVVQVNYSADPLPFVNADDELAVTVGLPESFRDVITLGAVWRLLTTIDPGDLSNNALASADLDRFNRSQPAEATTVASAVFAMFQKRLAEERAKLLERHPARIHYTRF